MTLYDRSARWAAALALGLAGLIGVGAATVLAAPARTAASGFELTLEGTSTATFSDMGDYWGVEEFTGQWTFRSRAPFCATGTFEPATPDPAIVGLNGGRSTVSTRLRFTCEDGTGSLTVSMHSLFLEGTWRILEGSGSYADLRGGGSHRGEASEHGEPPGTVTLRWRSTLQGVADRDAVAPAIDISKATATKLGRPEGAYSIKVVLALRDDVEGNPVSYRLRVAARGAELARRFGTARTTAVSMTLRIRPPVGAPTVGLQLTGVDPVGNAVSVRRALKLPR